MLRGGGRFVDDTDRSGQLWMRVVRASVARARVSNLDVEHAYQVPGVHAVLTADDLDEVPRIPLRVGAWTKPLDTFCQPVLAQDHVRYVGEPVAAVLAEDPYAAEDAAELVVVDYEALDPVLDAAEAVGSAEGDLSESAVDSQPIEIEREFGDVERAFEAAEHLVEIRLYMGRHSGVPLEARGLVADYDQSTDRLTLWGMTKVPHFNRSVLAQMFDMPEYNITVRSCDTGGAFGVRGEFYPEDFLVPYLARKHSRPVKWIEDRAEHFVATNHSREQHRQVQGAFDAEGHILGIRDQVIVDQGAYIRTVGMVVPEVTLSMMPGPYKVPAYHGMLRMVLTNKTPAGTFRSPGRYESTFACERLFDHAAAELGLDRTELRRRNLLGRSDLPHHRPVSIVGHEVTVEEGDILGFFDHALEYADYDSWVREAEALRGQGRVVGIGIGSFLEKGGGGGFETASVRVDRDGRIQAATGGSGLGQGAETTISQVVASELGVDSKDVTVVLGDTDLVATGVGSWGSRSAVAGGTAAMGAARETADLALTIAAELLEAPVEDLQLEHAHIAVVGSPGAKVSLGEVAAACDPVSSARRGHPAGLGATFTNAEPAMTYPYGVHLALVEVDPDTGAPRVLRYLVACEAGCVLHPAIVEGQLIGGAMQGIAGALLEEFRYDASGQPLSTSFMTYLMPTAAEAPRFEALISEEWPSRTNPLGVRGIGESGIVAAGATVASAIDDALGVPGTVRSLPVSCEEISRLAREPLALRSSSERGR